MQDNEYKGKLKTITNWKISGRISKEEFERLGQELWKAYQDDPANRVATPENIRELFSGKNQNTKTEG